MESGETYDFDPRRRRIRYRSLYDPRRRKGRVPPQLRSWVYGRRKARSYDPARRRRRRVRVRRRRYDYDYEPRRRIRRRRYDIPLANRFWGALLQPVITTLGAIFHNWLTAKKGILSGSFQVGNLGVVGHAGLLGGIGGAIVDYTTPNRVWGSIANAFGSGMLAEAVNVPAIEQVVTPQAIAKATGQGAVTEAYIPA